MQQLEQLNLQFGIKNKLRFEQNESGFIMIVIDNDHSSAKISTYGGQILSFWPHDQDEDVLYLSKNAIYEKGEAIRGGIPVCWPWFGEDALGLGLPAHGFARKQVWRVVESLSLNDGNTSVTLMLSDTEKSRAVWPYRFELYMKFIVGEKLTISLQTENKSDEAFMFTQALHAYFNVSDLEKTHVSGLSGKSYLDKLDGFKPKQQEDNIIFDKEVDRIFQYQKVPNLIHLVDAGFNRKVDILSVDGSTTVIWNPGSETVINIKDLANDSHRQFICVETANVADDEVMLNPNEQHNLTAVYSVLP